MRISTENSVSIKIGLKLKCMLKVFIDSSEGNIWGKYQTKQYNAFHIKSLKKRRPVGQMLQIGSHSLQAYFTL